MIYLASPYTDRSNTVMENRYRMVLEAAAELTRQGQCVYSPIVHFHPMACIYDMPRDIEFWETHSKTMIDRAEMVLVIQIEGWEASIGVVREIEYAKSKGIPVEFQPWAVSQWSA